MHRLLTIIAGISIALIGLSVSLVVFAFVALFGSVAFIYYWWKTREIRALMKAHIEERQRAANPGSMNDTGGIVIEGEWQSDAAKPQTNPQAKPTALSNPNKSSEEKVGAGRTAGAAPAGEDLSRSGR